RRNIRDGRSSIDDALGGFTLEPGVARRGRASGARASRRCRLVEQGAVRDIAHAGSPGRMWPDRLPTIAAGLPAGTHGRPMAQRQWAESRLRQKEELAAGFYDPAVPTAPAGCRTSVRTAPHRPAILAD